MNNFRGDISNISAKNFTDEDMACRYFWREVYCNHVCHIVDATHFFYAPPYMYVQGRYRQVNLR